MYKITVKTETEEKTGFFEGRVLLSDALEKLGISQNKPCGGQGVCGKCKVIVEDEEVLSCKTYTDKEICIYYKNTNKDVKALTSGYMSDFLRKPLVEDGYGMAVDIGTTTIAGYIYKFPECECVKSEALENTQAVYGADVISRIEYANRGGLTKLGEMARDQIKKLSNGFDIDKYVITGNTTMLHLLTGKSPEGIAVSPFTPKTLFGEWYQNAYLVKCISAYVGADITTSILSSGMLGDKTSFLVDIGTNGEMAVYHKGKIVCCSTAAGPAFEGAGISQGSLAQSGAIDRVYIENGEIKYTTIDNKEPVGICGTGIIDAVSCMKELGIIDETGYMENEFEIGDSKVFITLSDIRAVQLAKSAIRAGIDTLLKFCDIEYSDIERFYIAGGFGSFIDVKKASKIGLIPTEVIDKTVMLGNAAGSGAAMILQSSDVLKQSEEIVKKAVTVELSTDEFFMEKYINNMMFN